MSEEKEDQIQPPPPPPSIDIPEPDPQYTTEEYYPNIDEEMLAEIKKYRT